MPALNIEVDLNVRLGSKVIHEASGSASKLGIFGDVN